MRANLQIVDLDASNMDALPCCGVKNPAHEGRVRKECWLRSHFGEGVRAKVVLTPDGRQCGYIECLPGEYAWRGVDARGYLFIHCVWTWLRQHQNKGLASSLVEACVEDAQRSGMHGVAVLARDRPWLAGSGLFRKNGFEVVDEAPPDYQLLVKKLDPLAPAPRIKPATDANLRKYGRGLTIVQSDQCPHSAKFTRDIQRIAADEYGLESKLVSLRTCREAQSAPTPYAVFSVLYEGRLIADHQISGTRFRNIMRKLLA